VSTWTSRTTHILFLFRCCLDSARLWDNPSLKHHYCKAITTMLNGPDQVAFEKGPHGILVEKTGRAIDIMLWLGKVLSDAGVKLVYELCAFD
jgi:hypothetical protein